MVRAYAKSVMSGDYEMMIGVRENWGLLRLQDCHDFPAAVKGPGWGANLESLGEGDAAVTAAVTAAAE